MSASKPAPTASRRWAPAVAQEHLRALYRSVERGLVDEELLLEVGWALWARARGVAEVSTAVHTGRVACLTCGGEAIRLRRLAQSRPVAARPVSCAHCGYQGDWSDVRDAMRRRPRCLECRAPLEWRYAQTALECPACAAALSFKEWLRRMGARATLPCPRCLEPLRRPRREAGPLSLEPLQTDPERSVCTSCGEAHTPAALRAHWRAESRCPCGGTLTLEGHELTCAACGRAMTRGQFTRLLAARRTGPCPGCGAALGLPRDTVRCGSCGDERAWSAYQRAWQGRRLMTGAGVPVCEAFVEGWPQCRTPEAQMIAVDSFIHALHFGPLAPLLVAGDRASVLHLLDELGGL